MEQLRVLLQSIEKEIKTDKFINFYQEIRKKYHPISSFPAPYDLINYLLKQQNRDFVLNDKILYSLISEYQNHSESDLISKYLLITFKPGLLKLFLQFRQRSRQLFPEDDLDLWCQITALFFEELNYFRLLEDTSNIASKILGRLKNRLRDYFKECFKTSIAEAELRQNPDLIKSPYSLPSQEEKQIFLQNLVQSGVISETDKYILLGISVHGKSIKTLSQELKHFSYENLRQRKSRLKRIIQSFLKKNEKNLSQFGLF